MHSTTTSRGAKLLSFGRHSLIDFITLYLHVLGNFACFLASACLFFKFTFSNSSLRNTIRVSNSLDQDQARCFVGPELGPNCLQRYSADDSV